MQTPKEIIPTRRLSDKEFLERILKTEGAAWAKKFPWAKAAALNPLQPEIEKWEDLVYWGKILCGVDLSKNELYNMMLWKLRVRGAMVAIYGDSGQLQGMDIPTQLIIATAAGAGYSRDYKGGEIAEETSKNEEDAEREERERREKEARLIPHLQKKINEQTAEIEEREREIRKLRREITAEGEDEEEPPKKRRKT